MAKLKNILDMHSPPFRDTVVRSPGCEAPGAQASCKGAPEPAPPTREEQLKLMAAIGDAGARMLDRDLFPTCPAGLVRVGNNVLPAEQSHVHVWSRMGHLATDAGAKCEPDPASPRLHRTRGGVCVQGDGGGPATVPEALWPLLLHRSPVLSEVWVILPKGLNHDTEAQEGLGLKPERWHRLGDMAMHLFARPLAGQVQRTVFTIHDMTWPRSWLKETLFASSQPKEAPFRPAIVTPRGDVWLKEGGYVRDWLHLVDDVLSGLPDHDIFSATLR